MQEVGMWCMLNIIIEADQTQIQIFSITFMLDTY